MDTSYIKLELNKRDITNQSSFINGIREVIQKCILVGLSKTDFFSKAAFYGGTCLRIFHNLPRFSEDLDFCIIDNKYASIDLEDYVNKSLNYINSFGLNAFIYTKGKKVETSVKSCFINVDLNNLKNQLGYDNFNNFPSGQLLSVKTEVETNYIDGAKYEYKKLLLPSYALIKCFDLPSLFAGKLNAIIYRSWGNRVKGRDYYDFYFYIANEAPYNLNYIANYSKKEITNQDEVISALLERFNHVDFNTIKKDIFPFIDSHDDLSYINKDVYISLLEDLKAI